LTEAYVGIDVSFAKKKRLPVCVCKWQRDRLIPLPLRRSNLKPPLGIGNRAALVPDIVEAFAHSTRSYLRDVEGTEGVAIRKIAIDAPSAPKRPGIARRAAERSMDQQNISCFATPSRAEFDGIVERAQLHLAAGGEVSRIPHANQLWMLVGFALFEVLSNDYDCIEVYPQATVAALGISGVHKSKREGLKAQMAGVANATGWSGCARVSELRETGYGSNHDKLDAYLSAWVASLPEPQREPCGEAPDDVIWVPRKHHPS
jgi:hypothetical protein